MLQRRPWVESQGRAVLVGPGISTVEVDLALHGGALVPSPPGSHVAFPPVIGWDPDQPPRVCAEDPTDPPRRIHCRRGATSRDIGRSGAEGRSRGSDEVGPSVRLYADEGAGV